MNSGGTAGAVFCPVGFRDEHTAADRTAFQVLIPENLRFQRPVQRQDRPAEPLTADRERNRLRTGAGVPIVKGAYSSRPHNSSTPGGSGRLPVSAALGSCGKGNRLACALWAAVVYMGSLSCVSSILLSVAALPKRLPAPFLRRVPALARSPQLRDKLSRSDLWTKCPEIGFLRCFPCRGIPFRTVIHFSRCSSSMNYPKSTPK